MAWSVPSVHVPSIFKSLSLQKLRQTDHRNKKSQQSPLDLSILHSLVSPFLFSVCFCFVNVENLSAMIEESQESRTPKPYILQPTGPLPLTFPPHFATVP